MKNFNLFNFKRLWTDSHEKQSPQRFGRYAVMLIMLLTLGVVQMWAAKGFWSSGQWNASYNNGGDDVWGGTFGNAGNWSLGTQTTLSLKNAWVKTYSNDGWKQSQVIMYYDWTSGGTTHEYKTTKNNVEGDPITWDFAPNYDLIANAPNNPGNNTLYMHWRLDNYVSSGTSTITFTIPGFTNTSPSGACNAATLGSSSSTTISFGQHYGTALTTLNCVITDDTDGDFSVTSISETGVTVQFAPSEDGNKTATLTIIDAHTKTCVISLSATTQRTVTYSKGMYGTGSDHTANKLYNTNLTLAGSGYFTRTGYHQTGWNTNPAGTGGDSYALGGTYTSNDAITLYPTWTANTYTINFNDNHAQYTGEATGSTASVVATYDANVTLTANGFTLPGYTFAGWATSAAGTKVYNDGQTLTKPNFTSENGGSYTLYAKWTEHLSAITINTPASYQGSLDVTGVRNLGVTTTVSVTATAANGFKFDSWTKTDNAVLSSTTTNPVTVSADGTDGGSGSVTAVFVPRFAVVGTDASGNYGAEINGMPGTTDYSNTLDYYGTNDFRCTLSLKGNTNYKFSLRDLKLNKYLRYKDTPGSYLTINDVNAERYWLNDYNQDVTFTLASNGSDEITFHVFGFGGDHVTLHLLSSDGSLTAYTVTFDSQTFYGDNTNETSTTGGTVSAKDWKNFTLTSGQYAKAGKAVTFTAEPTDGYAFAGWYSDAACTEAYVAGDGVVIADNVLTLTFNANKAVYAKFVEKMTTVNLAAENGTIKLEGETDSWSDVTSILAGVHTNPHIKPVPAEGYFFTGWVRTAGSDYELQDGTGGAKAFETEADSIVYLVGRGDGATSGQTLTAKFEKLEKIYFKNYFSDGSTTTRWSQVYVYFDISWGTGGDANRAITSDKAYYKKAMTKLDDTDIYWAFVPRSVTTGNLSNVAFSDASMTTSYTFYSSGSRIYAATRGDYGAHLNMFVPYHVAKYTNLGNVDYFDNGYWRNYGLEAGEEAGYTMRLRTGSDTYRTMGEFLATENPDIIKYRYRLDTITHTQFMVQSAGNLKYKTKSDAVVTISACNDVLMSEHTSSDGKFILTPNRLGYYVITIDQSGDEMKMSVNYPLAVGDYILEHTYVNESGTTIKTHSDVIKYDSAANVTRYSMFLSKSKAGSTSTLKLRKCTNAATQTWSAGDDTNLSSILTQLASDGNGVYQFDLSVDKTNNRVNAVVTDSTRLYTGKYYIKTDSITGGWINYKRNALEHNTLTFKASNPNSFDYYYCKFFYPIGGSGVNPGKIKCVIANDYCNAVSDTLFGDEIATGSDPTVPSYTTYKGTSIRFSYNSTTNQLKRTYLGASANDYYLDINVSTDNMVTATVTIDEVEYTEDLYPSDFASTDRWAKFCRFDDTEDWVYEKVVKVKPGAKGGIVAKFGDTTQDLLASDHLLLGCKDGSCTGEYDILLVYDFKTNYLMASWIPGGAVSDKLKDVDMLWERVADNSAQQISFSGSGSLEKVKVVGAIRFDYDSVYYSASGDHWTNLSSWSPASRRWLKYFVSFPFDVPVSSVFGLAGAELGRDYIIQKYNGDKRAKEGLYFGDGGNFWENLTKDSIMHANEGYCVIFDNDYARGWYGSWWNHKKSGSHVYLYFPAKDTIASITGADKEVTVAKHKCNINRYFYELDDEYKLTRKNHIQTDSHWNLIGTPQFHDAYIKSQTTDTAGLELTAYYYLDYSENKWKVQSIAEKPVFKAMHSYWVQWAGTIEWTTDPTKSAFKAPARNQKQARKLSMKLNLMYNGKATDWTYLEMAENADEDFKLCEDLCKVYNQNSTHIYTYAGDYDVAYNKLPIAGRTVNVGVDIYRNGTYTFAMPDNFDGVVILVDNVTETRTNLAAGNYEVYLNKGTYNSRFSLEIGVNSTPTEINDVQDAQGTKARKMMIDGVLYIVKDNVIYDARGNRVQ